MTRTALQVIEADLTWTGVGFERGIRVEVDSAGRITRVGVLESGPTIRLGGQALLPGFVNAHSHAFQRGLRGLGERFPEGAGSFWSWREAMYKLVNQVTPEMLFDLSIQAFREMRASGITTVGEFHYLHHASGSTRYQFDSVIRDAAREAGLRLALLQTYYRTGGVQRPASLEQQRFVTPDLPTFLAQLDRLEASLDRDRESLGIVAHSIRAASPDEIGALHAESIRRGLPFHLHLEEQIQEVTDSLDAYDQRPMAMLLDLLPTLENVTAVHCTHTDRDDLLRYVERGGNVCICPLTEANLGDGIPQLEPLPHGASLCLGTDSNSRIAMTEEMRWLEYAQRLRYERRGVLRGESGHVARRLLGIGTVGGARSLGLPVGEIRPGLWADFTAFDLGVPALQGVPDERLLDALVFGTDPSAVTRTAVGGRWDR